LEQPLIFGDGRFCRSALAQVVEVFLRNRAEGVLSAGRRRDLVELALGARVDALLKQRPRGVAPGARLGERGCGEGANRKELFNAGEPIAVSPELVSVRLDLKGEAVAVRKPVWVPGGRFRFRGPSASCGYRIVGTAAISEMIPANEGTATRHEDAL